MTDEAKELLEALEGLLDGVLNDVDKERRIRAAERAIAKAKGLVTIKE